MSLINGIYSFTEELKKNSIEYAIIGGLAVFAYGGERTTFDVDFLIDSEHRNIVKEIANKLHLKIVNENKEVLQLSGPIQIDIVFANRPISKGMLKRAHHLPSLPFPVVMAEDLIGLKIQAFTGDASREFIDKGDILTIFRNVPNLDIDKVKEYADIFNVWNEIEKIKKLL